MNLLRRLIFLIVGSLGVVAVFIIWCIWVWLCVDLAIIIVVMFTVGTTLFLVGAGIMMGFIELWDDYQRKREREEYQEYVRTHPNLYITEPEQDESPQCYDQIDGDCSTIAVDYLYPRPRDYTIEPSAGIIRRQMRLPTLEHLRRIIDDEPDSQGT